MKKTVLIGATPNPQRFAFKVAEKLIEKKHDIALLGVKKGKVGNKDILDIRKKHFIEEVHTVTMYINKNNQAEWMEYIVNLSPKRIIFNPGTENVDFEKYASEKGIDAIRACTLTMLIAGTY